MIWDAVFWVFSALALIGALGVLLARNPLRAGLGLLLNFASLGVLYLVAGAPFLGVAQWLVYAGGIAVFMLVAVSLLGFRVIPGDLDLGFKGFLAVLAVLAFALGVGGVVWIYGVKDVLPVPLSVGELGKALVGPYAVGFELVSVLVLIGAVAAVSLTRRESQ